MVATPKSAEVQSSESDVDFNIKLLRYFVAIAENESLSSAAKKLNVAQPSLSQRMYALEAKLGFALFARGKRSIELSQEGHSFLPVAREMVSHAASMSQMIVDMRRGALGRLVIGRQLTASTAQLYALIDRFSCRFPLVDVVVESEVYSAELLEKIDDGRFDLGFMLGYLPQVDIESLLVGRCRMSLLLPTESALNDRNVIRLDDLRGWRIATHRREASPHLYDQMFTTLAAAGAELVAAPDAHSTMVAHYAQQHRIMALAVKELVPTTLPDMVWREVEDLAFWMDYSLVRSKRSSRPFTINFFRLAQEKQRKNSSNAELRGAAADVHGGYCTA